MSAPNQADLLDIRITDGSRPLEQARCRHLLLPDGRPGALWRGLVYPLSEGSVIDIAGEASAPGLCRAPVERRPSFAVLDAGHEAYLVLPGSLAACESAASRLRAGGLAVRRTGRYLGDPVHGCAADWFVFFEKPADATDLEARLAELIGGEPAGRCEPEAQPDIRNRLLHAELIEVRAREAALRRERDGLRQMATRAASDADDLALLKAELEAERAARFAVEEERNAIKAALRSASSQPAAPPATRPGRLQKEIEAVLESLLAEIRLLRGSMEVMTIEYAERGPLYRALAELQAHTGRLPPAWKSVQSVPGWWERHISTGRERTGRIYAHLDREKPCWGVLVSEKSEQTRDVEWMRRYYN